MNIFRGSSKIKNWTEKKWIVANKVRDFIREKYTSKGGTRPEQKKGLMVLRCPLYKDRVLGHIHGLLGATFIAVFLALAV